MNESNKNSLIRYQSDSLYTNIRCMQNNIMLSQTICTLNENAIITIQTRFFGYYVLS
jgi:hypothetical protein